MIGAIKMSNYYLMTSVEEPVKKMFTPVFPTPELRYEQPVEPHIRISESIGGALLNNLELLKQAVNLKKEESLIVRLYVFEFDPKANLYIYDTCDLIENDLAPDAIVTKSLWLLNRVVPREIKTLNLSQFIFEKRYVFSNELNKYYLGHLKDKKLENNYQHYLQFFSELMKEAFFVTELDYPLAFQQEVVLSEPGPLKLITVGPVTLPKIVAEWVNESKMLQRTLDELFDEIDQIEDELKRKMLSEYAIEQADDLVKAYCEGYHIL